MKNTKKTEVAKFAKSDAFIRVGRNGGRRGAGRRRRRRGLLRQLERSVPDRPGHCTPLLLQHIIHLHIHTYNIYHMLSDPIPNTRFHTNISREGYTYSSYLYTYISSVQKESSMVRNYSAYKDPADFLSSLNV